ncbi:hypothetical protein [Aliikangiella maris]|uniref:Uncharacterized protein n=2 Tax=Aliikangiella maris TaxID=3162458 RepID=A0ABV3MU52_9GAMM
MKNSIRILQVVAIIHIVAGLALPFIAQIEWIGEGLVNLVFTDLTLTSAVYKKALYIIALFGPTIASWGILLWLLVQSYCAQPTKQKWLGINLAILVWFIGDTLFSMINGIHQALVLNGLVMLSLLISLWKIRRLMISVKS